MTSDPFIAAKAALNPENFAMANCLRALAMDAVEQAQSGHPGASIGMADAATVLFRNHLKFDAANPDWPDRDRFVLSNGHASMLLYGLLHLNGYQDPTIDQIRAFRQWGAITAGHPECGHAKGIETTAGPLGQGFATAVGMALAERRMAAEFPGLIDHMTYVMLSDACLQEGIGQEAISLAGHLGLGKLIVLYDDNEITIDGPTSASFSQDVLGRFAACGWHVQSCDGHDADAVDRALTAARLRLEAERPSMFALKTLIGFRAPTKADSQACHVSPLGATEVAQAKLALGWTSGSFVIPNDLVAKWRAIGARGASARAAWTEQFNALPQAHQAESRDRNIGAVPPAHQTAVDAARTALFAAPKKVATRKASQVAVEALTPVVPALVGGSADLTGSNLNRVPGVEPLTTRHVARRYTGYGLREFAMAAAMTGMALHGGIIPYGGRSSCSPFMPATRSGYRR